MQYDKLALSLLFSSKSLSFLAQIKPEYFKSAIARVLTTALKKYVKKFGTIPDIEVFKADISLRIAEDKLPIYIGYLDGLPKNVEVSVEEILVGLKEQYIVLSAEKDIEKLVDAITNRDAKTVTSVVSGLHSILNVTEKTPIDIVESIYQPSKIRTVKSFLPTMNEYGAHLGGLVIVGAGTGHGKSVFTLNQLMFSYKEEHLSTCLLNLELGEDETIARMYSQATGTPFKEVYGNEALTDKVQNWKNEYFQSDSGEKFYIRSIRYNTAEIEETIRAMAGLGVTVFGIDYLQLVDSVSNQKEWEALRDLIRNLHSLTLELGIVIISPVQINLDEIDEESGTVKIKVRGSRELENSSTVFLFLYQTAEESKSQLGRVFTIKSRNSEKHTYLVSTKFDCMKFEDTGVVV